MKPLPTFICQPLLAFALAVASLAPAAAQNRQPAPAQPSLAQALNPDGTLRPGTAGSFDARRFRMHIAPNGQPVFRPASPSGADDYRWQSGFGLPNGANGHISVVVRAGNNIYIGGGFNAVSNVVANHVARWDGTAWSALGPGLGNVFKEDVTALAVAPNGDLYAAGYFAQAGNVTVNGLARWNGTSWGALGSGVGNSGRDYVNALAVAPNGDLYVSGSLTLVGGTAVSNVARWNGAAWSALGSGIGSIGNNAYVQTLAVAPNGDLYAGGYFDLAGGATANNIARWNGTGWNALGTGSANGLNSSVYALVVAPNGDVYVGGSFSQAGTVPANNIARWNGMAWSTLGTSSANGVSGTVYALAPNGGGELFVGGQYIIQAGGVAAAGLARWNGTTWSALGAGISSENKVNTLAVAANGDLFVGADLVQFGAVTANRIARWNGSAWNALGTGTGNGLNSEANAVAVAPNGDVYVAGYITQAGNLLANGVVRWNGRAWSALGTGLQYRSPNQGGGTSPGAGEALAVAPNGDLYVGGDFNLAGGVPANGVAKWDGTTWSALGAGLQDNTSGTQSVSARTLVVAANGDLYVGGDFLQAGAVPAAGIARWNGTAWNALGAGVRQGGSSRAMVRAVAIASTGTVYAAGYFTQAGGVPAAGIARWNGNVWAPLGTGFGGPDDEVDALAVAPNGDLYVGGFFSQAGGVPANGIARWNGSSFSALGSGISGGFINGVAALALTPNGDLCLGGLFEQAGGTAAANLARWNGSSFSALGSGLNSPVLALAVGANNKVCAGGYFGAVGDGSKTSVGFAIYDPAAVSATRAAAAALPLYPNPAHDHVTVKFLSGIAQTALTLIDALGREVRRYPTPTSNEATLDLRGLPAGVYVLRNGAGSQRLVVE